MVTSSNETSADETSAPAGSMKKGTFGLAVNVQRHARIVCGVVDVVHLVEDKVRLASKHSKRRLSEPIVDVPIIGDMSIRRCSAWCPNSKVKPNTSSLRKSPCRTATEANPKDRRLEIDVFDVRRQIDGIRGLTEIGMMLTSGDSLQSSCM